ncbi:MAG: lipocalin family protein [Pseudomonadota bacterium]|nr:MAG: lipocalin family protein [Pseudomonadota bacterium]
MHSFCERTRRITAVGIALVAALLSGCEASPLLATVSKVDLERYTGKWYEIALLPNHFQRNCTHSTTATYKLREDGRIRVVNRCIQEDGAVNEIEGEARIVDNESNAKLEVSFLKLFGISMFWGDYWIIDLADDYRYAVIATPSRRFGWVLSRTPTMAKVDLQRAYAILHEQGYDTGEFRKSQQRTP